MFVFSFSFSILVLFSPIFTHPLCQCLSFLPLHFPALFLHFLRFYFLFVHTALLNTLEECLRLNEAYQEQYRLTKDKLLTMPKGKQFDFSETQIFSKFDLFCRRVIKLIDMFSTIHQFHALADHQLEGMEGLIAAFFKIIGDFKKKRHELLDYQSNKFDRDYVEFNIAISDLEGSLQQFINQSFENITSIEQSLTLLKKFQTILQRESLKNDLDSKFTVIFHNYGLDLTTVQEIYEKYKHNPPLARNMPPVAGNITWSRHLLQRIEEPMRRFESNPTVLATKDSRKIIKTYNKVARTLVAFEYLWYEAWCRSVETAKAGLQATLIIRHPETQRLYVNFDPEILQLIRESKCLSRLGIDVPEAAKVVMLQEDKFKGYFNELTYLLHEYQNVVSKQLPVTVKLLRPHVADIELKIRPGMVTLTWTSMNIDTYKTHVHTGLEKLSQLLSNVNDIVENRIEKNLKMVTRTLLVNLPKDESLALDEFVIKQEHHVREYKVQLQAKNREIEHAVENIIDLATKYVLDPHIEPVSEQETLRVRTHYNKMMYTALLNCTRNSLLALKKRICARGGSGFLFLERPFFEVDVQLAVPSVRLSPSLEDIQRAVNKGALAVLRVSKSIWLWGQGDISAVPDEANPEDLEGRRSFFEQIGKDVEIVKVALLLTGALYGTRNQVAEYLKVFTPYDWLWKDDMEAQYRKFMMHNPTIDDFENELKRFLNVEQEIASISPIHVIGALSLNTANIKLQLRNESRQWKVQYSDKVHQQARTKLYSLMEYIRKTTNAMSAPVENLHNLRYCMSILKEVREKESSIEIEISPMLDMYAVLDHYIPGGVVDKDEMDQKSIIRTSWRKLSDFAEEVGDNLQAVQGKFRRKLLGDIATFGDDVSGFRSRYVQTGPAVQGIEPREAVNRLKKFKSEFDLLKRKHESYAAGEDLFALKKTEYPALTKTHKELTLLTKLYDLYMEVVNTLESYNDLTWAGVMERIEAMAEAITASDLQCKRLPKSLREWEAYNDLSTRISNFLNILPLLQDLSKDSIQNRHWVQVMQVTGSNFVVDPNELTLRTLLNADLLRVKDDIEDICDSADKQMAIDTKLSEVRGKWSAAAFTFEQYKGKRVSLLKAYGQVIEDLEESQLALQTMLSMRHVGPFRESATSMLSQLSDTADTLELWVKVQLLWQSLESVFTGGDIMRQMPLEAKKFSKIDKDWTKSMSKAEETLNVVACCSNELLKNSLPIMYAELEKCQKSLEGYLEQKRSKFPRFYFVSNSVLLQILSRGSDYNEVQQYYEKLFDSMRRAVHEDTKGQSAIVGIQGIRGSDIEDIKLLKPVQVIGNIEGWLLKLQQQMQETMKDTCERAADDCSEMELRDFVDRYPGQFALLGIQFNWTHACTEALDRCRSSKTAMQENNKRQLGLLSELSSWTLQDLGTKMNRRKVETLITIQVHQRDVFAELVRFYKERKVSSPNDFEWLKQARFYWNPDDHDALGEGACIISICDVDFRYSHEYLGCKARLVITPLTDRAYITLSQALGMGLGGSPAGPAGTGKTETVKDLGATLGIFVIVTNCTDNHSYKDMAKIFKGLCQAGLWGCFDEFNRIRLPVLSVVAQQVLAITNAKRTNQVKFPFPGDASNDKITLNPAVGYFITMNPGYQGRQELPENLKILFRGVAMMVPDREIIIRVKLCSVGYARFSELARKFRVLYRLCEEQLSNQRHYDFGLRNILSVLRAAGSVKRQNVEKDEAQLLMGTLRNMNLSKLVAQDTPLFLSLLNDLFPGFEHDLQEMGGDEDVSTAIREYCTKEALVHHETWVAKVHQLDDTVAVRHGIMIIGPAGGGKSQIVSCLAQVRSKLSGGITHKLLRMNPKAIRADEMFGETDQLSGEWMDGVFASMWSKSNQRTNKFNTWLVCDGPVDAIWIENLNTVLDDNKILTLANGDRIPMTDNVKLMFEVENLNNASPATVSRAGIVYVSDTDLDWWPVALAWLRSRPESEQVFLEQFFLTLVGDPSSSGSSSSSGGDNSAFRFVRTACEEEVVLARVGVICGMCQLLESILSQVSLSFSPSDMEPEIERIFLFALVWSVGGRLTELDRAKFDSWLREKSQQMPTLPKKAKGEDALTIYDFDLASSSIEWERFVVPEWKFPIELDRSLSSTGGVNMASLLVPTIDSHRAQQLIQRLHVRDYPVLMVGGTGTAKTVTALMFFASLDVDREMVKKVAFSYATTGGTFQKTIENELDKRGGKMFGPPGSKQMTVFLDDMNMPLVNEWGDQPTLEAVRQLVADGTFSFLDKDRRGDLKIVEDLRYIAAANSPAGGKNDLPNRLKRLFFTFNMIPPSNTTIDSIYGRILLGRYGQSGDSKKKMTAKDKGLAECARKTIGSTIKLWIWVKKYFMPTPSKFHYLFNMRDLSRIFQGVMRAPRSVIKADKTLVQLWRHEVSRVFGDKLSTKEDQKRFAKKLVDITDQAFGKGYNEGLGASWFVDFLREDVYDEDGILTEARPQIYEKVSKLETVRNKAHQYLQTHNVDRPNYRMDLVFFDDALNHLLRISRILGCPRGNALLVGVGGSGKRSLTKLAAYIARQEVFELQINKMYNYSSLMEDVAQLFRQCGQQGQSVTWIFTEAHIKSEEYLEVVNSLLMSGEVNNLFPKDELNLMVADLRTPMSKQRPDLDDNTDNLIQFFIERVRQHLHLVLCLSPMHPKFAQRARRFPGMINGTMVDYFLSWPQSALEGVALGIMQDYAEKAVSSKITTKENNVEETTTKKGKKDKSSSKDKMSTDKNAVADSSGSSSDGLFVKSIPTLAAHMGQTHATVMQTCVEYKEKMRRYAHQTPKTFLSYIALYQHMYTTKKKEVAEKEGRVLLGLAKLKQGGKDVEKMKIVLAEQEEILLASNQECTKMLSSLQVSSLEAKKESDAVGIIRDACEKEAASIDQERKACEEDLAKAQPYLDDAETAVNSIKPADLNELKKLPKPSDIIKLVFDCVSILRMQPMNKVEKAPVTLGVGKEKKTFMFVANSYVIIKAGMLSDAGFLKSLFHFSQHEKDNMNDETLELLAPYLELEAFVPSVARNASKASVSCRSTCSIM
jgi:dynein heavy chain